MIHGMVDRPLIFSMDELRRLPYVTRVHFIECTGTRARASLTVRLRRPSRRARPNSVRPSEG